MEDTKKDAKKLVSKADLIKSVANDMKEGKLKNDPTLIAKMELTSEAALNEILQKSQK